MGPVEEFVHVRQAHHLDHSTNLPATMLRQRFAPQPLKVGEGGRIVSVAAMIAVAANTEGTARDRRARHRPVEAETFSADFLERLTRRGPARRQGRDLGRARRAEGRRQAGRRRDMATLSRPLHARCAGLRAETQETVVAAAIRQAFIQPDRETAGQVWRHVADQLRPRFEKFGRLMDEAGTTCSPT